MSWRLVTIKNMIGPAIDLPRDCCFACVCLHYRIQNSRDHPRAKELASKGERAKGKSCAWPWATWWLSVVAEVSFSRHIPAPQAVNQRPVCIRVLSCTPTAADWVAAALSCSENFERHPRAHREQGAIFVDSQRACPRHQRDAGGRVSRLFQEFSYAGFTHAGATVALPFVWCVRALRPTVCARACTGCCAQGQMILEGRHGMLPGAHAHSARLSTGARTDGGNTRRPY